MDDQKKLDSWENLVTELGIELPQPPPEVETQSEQPKDQTEPGAEEAESALGEIAETDQSKETEHSEKERPERGRHKKPVRKKSSSARGKEGDSSQRQRSPGSGWAELADQFGIEVEQKKPVELPEPAELAARVESSGEEPIEAETTTGPVDVDMEDKKEESQSEQARSSTRRRRRGRRRGRPTEDSTEQVQEEIAAWDDPLIAGQVEKPAEDVRTEETLPKIPSSAFATAVETEKVEPDEEERPVSESQRRPKRGRRSRNSRDEHRGARDVEETSNEREPVEIFDETEGSVVDSEPAETPEDTKEKSRRGRKRRRGSKHRSKDAENRESADTTEADEAELIDSSETVEDIYDAEEDDDEANDRPSSERQVKKRPARNIPTWEEAIDFIISSNLQNRQRSGGGRRAGGRRR